MGVCVKTNPPSVSWVLFTLSTYLSLFITPARNVLLHLSPEFPPRNHQQLYVEKCTKRGKVIHLFTAASTTDQNALQSGAFIFAACQESFRLCVVLTATTHCAKPSKCIQQRERLVFERHSGKCSRIKILILRFITVDSTIYHEFNLLIERSGLVNLSSMEHAIV